MACMRTRNTDVAQTDKNPVILGHVSGLFGVKGWFKVHSYTEPREAILTHRNWLLERDGDWQPVRIEEGKPHGKTVVVRLEGVTDRDAAASYVGAEIGISRNDMPELKSGEYYWADLEGMQVVHIGGRVLGKVSYLLATGANDVLVVQGDQEILIPFVRNEVIKDVDVANGVISVDWEWD
ncbi:MAG: 16S rRNA processing protein RimM [Woeseiaceae bacterium]|jgi:16S rRNA processing protein RimM